MSEELKSKNKIYKNLFLLSLIIVICISIISPLVVSHLKSSWTEKSGAIIKQIAEGSKKIIIQREFELSDALLDIKNYLKTDKSILNTRQNIFLKYFKNKYPHNSLMITDSSGKIVLWLDEINGFLKNSSRYSSNEFFFYDAGIQIYLVKTDEVTLFTGLYKIFLFTPVKKMYQVPLQTDNDLGLEEELSEKYDTNFKIGYSANISLINDNQYFSYPLFNNHKNRIGTVTFRKPILNKRVNKLTGRFSIVRSAFFILGIIFLFLYYLPKISRRKNIYFKLLIYIFVISGIRIIIFVLGFPSKILNSELLNPKYFSSQFAFGIVKSPLEFFITTVFAVAISIVIFLFVKKYFIKMGLRTSVFRFWILAAAITIFTLLLMRIVGAMSKSVIFDSSIYYFSDFSLISKPPATLMQINVLLAGLAIFMIIISAYVFLLSLLNFDGLSKKKIILLLFVMLQVFGIAYHFIQLNPQVEIFTGAIVLFLLFFVAYLMVEKNLPFPKLLLLAAFISSFATAMLLNYYNTQQEKESLKNLSHDLFSPKNNWYEFLVHQTITSKSLQKIGLKEIKIHNKYSGDIAAFRIWSNSALSSATARVKVEIFRKDFSKVGAFNLGYPPGLNADYGSIDNQILMPRYVRKNIADKNSEIISGIIPLKEGNKLLGYVSISILNEKGINNLNKLPGFLSKHEPFFNPAINDQKLSIFEISNAKLISQYSDVNLNRQNINQILNEKYNNLNEAWINTKLGDKDYVLYAYRPSGNNRNRIFVIGIREKEISFDLFHFFKVFFVHSILIILILVLYVLFIFKKRKKIIWSFNAKLFFAFIIISVIPLILMAISIRELTEEKNNSAIYYKLEKRAKSVGKYLNNYEATSHIISKTYYNKASTDLNINYTIFKDKKFLYSSKEQYYNIGLLHTLMSSAAYYAQKNLGLKVYVEKEIIGHHKFNSLYYKANILGENIVIEISDAFNPISLPMSGTELDIFLFGSYSLAVILIIAFSTLLAKQISSPIRQLTLAAKSVAGGDFNLELPQSEKGEVKDLVNEFNYMVKELKKSQSELAEIERETAWKEMAKQVAHEVKNPLTPMKLAVQQLVIAYSEKSPKFDKIFATVTDTLIKQIEVLKNIASEFSGFARMPSLKVEKIDLLNILNDVENLFAEEKTHINITANDNKIYVKADTDQLRRTMINLVRNSIQAKAKTVEMKITADNHFAEIRVIDNGQGISQEKLSKVFDVDFTTKKKGMGLGLSLAKKFIENIGGEINVESTSPQGTVIMIKLQKINV